MQKGYLIDPNTPDTLVTEVEYNDFRDIQKLIGCDCFTSITLGGYGDDDGFCDDDGLNTATMLSKFVIFPDLFCQPIVGRVLVVGPADDEGESTPPTKPIEYYRENTKVLSYGQVNLLSVMGAF